MPTRREYSGNAPATTLSGPITNASTSFTVTDGTGYPTGAVGPFFLVIDPRTASEEKVLVTTRTGTTMSGAARGQDGTPAVAHSAGAVVEHVWTAVDAGEANRHGADTTLDDHTQYHNAARHGSVAHTTAMIGDGQVTTAKIADAAVAAAKLAAAIPLGVLGTATATANQGGITAEVDLTGLSVAVTAGSARRLRIDVAVKAQSGISGDRLVGTIKEGTTELGQFMDFYLPAANVAGWGVGFAEVTPTAGAHTYKATLQRFSGTGTANTIATASVPARITVTDIGAA